MKELIRINKDINGNPRYVCYYTDLLKESEFEIIKKVEEQFKLALSRAKQLGGKKCRHKNYKNYIVFQSYNVQDLINSIERIKN